MGVKQICAGYYEQNIGSPKVPAKSGLEIEVDRNQ